VPVWVIRDVAGGQGNGVVVAVWVEGARRGVAEGFDGDAVAAGGFDGEEFAECFPDADGLCGVFL
jgi:hypothetical protein